MAACFKYMPLREEGLHTGMALKAGDFMDNEIREELF